MISSPSLSGCYCLILFASSALFKIDIRWPGRPVFGVQASQNSAGIWVKVGPRETGWQLAGLGRCQYRHYNHTAADVTCHVSQGSIGGADTW